MKKRFPDGRGLCVVSALALFLISGYELVIRLDAMYKPVKMFFDLVFGEDIPLSAAMKYFDFTILHQPLYLTGCLILALICLACRRRTHLCFFLLPVALLLGVLGYQIDALALVRGWKLIRTLPLVGVSLASVTTYVANLHRRPSEPQSPRLNDAPRLRALAHAAHTTAGSPDNPPAKASERRGA